MKKECSVDEARVKAEIYCAKAERCKCEVLHKLQLWGAPEEHEENILAHLVKEGYIDESRYAKAFVRDKYRFSQWGTMKISQALRLKRILPMSPGVPVLQDMMWNWKRAFVLVS